MNDLNFLSTRIGRRFLGIFLIIALLSPVIIGWMAIRKSEAAIRQQTLRILRAASDGAEAQLREFLEHFKTQLFHISQHEKILEALESHSGAQSTADSSNIVSSLSDVLASQQQKLPDVQEVFVLDLNGRVFASSVAKNIGRDFSTMDFFMRGQHSFFGGDMFIDPNTGWPTWIMTSPINDPVSYRLLAIVAFRVDPQTLSDLTTGKRILSEGADTQSFRIGDTGETYIVNRNHLMITESRYLPGSILKQKVESLPVRVALERNEEIAANYIDYRGKEVSGASIILRKLDWIVITEIDFNQAFAPVRELRKQLVAGTIGLVLFALLLSWIFTWRLLRPIRLLSDSDRALARNDEAGSLIPENGLPNDELGHLIRQRNIRIKAVFDYQRQLEERTAKLQEMVSEIEHISYAIVHDMRAPLRAMQGFAKILEMEWEEQTPEERLNYLRHISTAAVRLDELIRDVLTYNKTVLGRASLHPVDVGLLLSRLLSSYPNLQPEHAEIVVEGNLPVVIGNEGLLTQCFSNLLDNAVKFATPGIKPRIRIWAEMIPAIPNEKQPKLSTQLVRVWIEDNGIGIGKDAQPRLFRMFQRLTHDHDGTGVGLAIVHKVVERMGGKIGVESEPGKGSRFWIELPGEAEPNRTDPA
jgi:signal transduction histidine kinase